MMVTLKNNIILLRETKWRHGATARSTNIYLAEKIFLVQEIPEQYIVAEQWLMI